MLLMVCRTSLLETRFPSISTTLEFVFATERASFASCKLNAPTPAAPSSFVVSRGGGYTRPASVYSLKKTKPSKV